MPRSNAEVAEEGEAPSAYATAAMTAICTYLLLAASESWMRFKIEPSVLAV